VGKSNMILLVTASWYCYSPLDLIILLQDSNNATLIRSSANSSSVRWNKSSSLT